MADTTSYKTLGAKVTVHTITIPADATRLSSLITAAVATALGKSFNQLLQATVLGAVTAGTSRGAFLYGGTDALGYVADGVEKVLPVRGTDVYLKRISGDVTAQVECVWA
jgi:hypothetical protein